MPFFLLDAYTEMLPQLQAEEELRMVEAVTAGSGMMQRSDRDRYMKRLFKRASADRGGRSVKTLEDLAATGLPIVQSPGKAARG